MKTTVVEPLLHDVLSSLGYSIEPADHSQHKVLKDQMTLFVGHEFQVWGWLHITGQFTHPTKFEVAA